MMIVVPLVILLVPLGLTAFVSWYFWNSYRPIAIFVLIWCGVAIALNGVSFYPGQGVWVEGDRLRTPLYLLIMASPLMVYAWALRTVEGVRQALDAVPLPVLAGNQIYRIAGVTFYLGYVGGLYPAQIAFPAAILDIFIALTALPLAYLLARRPVHRLAIAWNVIGIFDFTLAIVLVLLSVYGVITLTPAPSALGQLPSILTAVFAVPFGLMVHAEFLRRLRHASEANQSGQASPA